MSERVMTVHHYPAQTALYARIAFEDTEERARLKAAGYRWDSARQVWGRMSPKGTVSVAAVADLVAHGYHLELAHPHGYQHAAMPTQRILGALHRSGVDLTTLPTRYTVVTETFGEADTIALNGAAVNAADVYAAGLAQVVAGPAS